MRPINMLVTCTAIGALAMSVTACSKKTATQAVVESNPVEAMALETFEPGSYPENELALVKSTVFIWKEDSELTPEHVSSVILAGRELDQMSLTSFEYKKKQGELRQRRKLKQESLPEDLVAKMKALEDKRFEVKNQDDAVYNFRTIVAETPNCDRSIRCRGARRALESAEADLVRLKQELEPMEAEIVSHPAQIELEQLQAEDDQIGTKKVDMEKSLRVHVRTISAAVDKLWDFTEVNFKLASDGSVTGRIKGWIEGCEDENDVLCTTENGRITDASYESIGGVLRFTVNSPSGDRYAFTVSRTKYDDPLGRVFFQGDILVTKADGSKRFGAAKFCDTKDE